MSGNNNDIENSPDEGEMNDINIKTLESDSLSSKSMGLSESESPKKLSSQPTDANQLKSSSASGNSTLQKTMRKTSSMASMDPGYMHSPSQIRTRSESDGRQIIPQDLNTFNSSNNNNGNNVINNNNPSPNSSPKVQSRNIAQVSMSDTLGSSPMRPGQFHAIQQQQQQQQQSMSPYEGRRSPEKFPLIMGDASKLQSINGKGDSPMHPSLDSSILLESSNSHLDQQQQQQSASSASVIPNEARFLSPKRESSGSTSGMMLQQSQSLGPSSMSASVTNNLQQSSNSNPNNNSNSNNPPRVQRFDHDLASIKFYLDSSRGAIGHLLVPFLYSFLLIYFC